MDLRVFFYRKFVAGKWVKKYLLCYIENVGATNARPYRVL